MTPKMTKNFFDHFHELASCIFTNDIFLEAMYLSIPLIEKYSVNNFKH